ncbi:MAG: tRNA pseudouridine(38-40) synthase TruA [Gammaproteobacteria bacterium]|nr:tRNA pseudouridine(38-40) synthase TruA [Gammaproteobacteria bacterium]
MRIALGVEYNGSGFHGWQIQENLITLQRTLENALSKVAAESVTVICAGRTDAGVHATNQVVHFETSAERDLRAWIQGTNSYLPRSISVKWAQVVDEAFSARFSAISRRYQYFIYNNDVRSSLYSSMTTWVRRSLDETQMDAASKFLIGEHDFSSFRSADCQSRTPKRHVFAVNVSRRNELVILDIIANSFLHHMVRNIAGVLIEIGEGRKETEWCKELISVKNRSLASKTAPPFGLYLTGVRYPDHYALPCDFRSPFFNG